MSAREENLGLRRLCDRQSWLAHYQAWRAAYRHYRSSSGNPWLVSPTTFTPDIGDEQYSLYDNARRTKLLTGIRRGTGLPCCPMCGSHHVGTLDHYLPREDYPEFSVMPLNLVPACALCNSGAKGGTFKGSAPDEYFLHPYFERALRRTLWQVEIVQPFEAANFRAIALPGLSRSLSRRVQFHLDHILDEQFQSTSETYWSRLPAILRVGATLPLTLTGVRQELRLQLRREKACSGVNSWRPAVLRGILADSAAIAYLHTKI